MKIKSYTRLFVTALLSSTLLISAGCSSKKVMPPPTDGQEMGEEYQIPAIPPAEESAPGYSEGDLAITEGNLTEGTLDDTVTTTTPGSEEFDPSTKTADYLVAHGRTSNGLQPVYFSFDQTIISPDMQAIIEGNVSFMKSNPSVYVIIEGNTDERGTNEYNMALGEKRSINVAKYMVSLGIESRRLRTVSLGEERPLFPEDSEDAHKYNRRADFVIE